MKYADADRPRVLLRRASLREIAAFPERFELLCANCHIEHHTAEREASGQPLTACLHCQTVFKVEPSVLARGSGRYCSRDCQFAHRAILAHDSLATRLWANVDKSQPCWRWTGYTYRGIGRINVIRSDGRCRPLTAPAAAYQVHYGVTTVGSRVMPSCGTRGCVNPEHLHLGPLYPRTRRTA